MTIANKEDFEAMWKLRYGNGKVNHSEARKFLDDFNLSAETNLKLARSLDSDSGYEVFNIGD